MVMGWRVSLLPVLCHTRAEVPSPDVQRNPRDNAAPPEREERNGGQEENLLLSPLAHSPVVFYPCAGKRRSSASLSKAVFLIAQTRRFQGLGSSVCVSRQDP